MQRLLAPSIVYDPPTLLYTILTQPVKTLIQLLDLTFNLLRPKPKPGQPAIRVASHVPDGDLLVHAGDLANLGNVEEIQPQIDWLNSLPHQHKVVIAGNHDRHLDPRSRGTLPSNDRNDAVNWRGLWYLQHSSVTLNFDGGRQLSIYGAPQTPATQKDDHAFRYPQDSDAWSDTVPRDVDILVTHTPPKYHLDLPAALGCEHLLREVWKVQPALHVFGHIHAGKSDFVGMLKGGNEVIRWDDGQRTLEHAMTRPNGFFRGIIDPRSWLDVARVVYYGVGNVLWEQIWGGSSPDSTRMVLASLMYCNTGELRNLPQVVYI
ncbi:hypothetical protein LTR09_009282 [Extremus antarcticus]|uniref:Calcineurin-like phosphoesterase domain-containing protein n=1 Tax=Extremus antarcticus TaxID=702011 RepID=A0AAJ0D8X6_9PEZI|nr:hypothetical protein LTR09_009282 [Extremus antarcticus]